MAKISKLLVLLSLIILSFQRRCTIRDNRKCEQREISICEDDFGCYAERGLSAFKHCLEDNIEYDNCCDTTFDLPCAKVDKHGVPLCQIAEEDNLCPKKSIEFLE
jgi:hypothetical protein